MTREPPMRGHMVRVPDLLWSAALQTAVKRGDVLAERVREDLVKYVEEGDGHEYP